MRELNIGECDEVGGGGIKVDKKNGAVTSTAGVTKIGKDGSVEIQTKDGWTYQNKDGMFKVTNAKGDHVDSTLYRWLMVPNHEVKCSW